MSIHFITGKPGGGKGLVALQKIIDELVNGDRAIITNLALRIEPWIRKVSKRGTVVYKPEIGLRNYLLSKYGKDFDCTKRIKLLMDDQTREFFLHRRNCENFIELKPQRDSNGRCIEFDTAPALQNGGVFYVIDEAWRDFGSRDWQNTGKGVLFYAAQHRKLGDDWLIVTQHTKQIETALRQVAQDYWVCTNHSKLKMGFFRQPDIFSVAIYDQAPTGAALQPMERKVFKLDKAGLGGCYDTAAGVGVSGFASADLNERKTGLPWWVSILMIIAMGYVILKVCKGAGWLATIGLEKPQVKAQLVTPVVQKQIQSVPGEAAKDQTTVTNRFSSALAPEVCGSVNLDGKIRFYLTDGQVVSPPQVTSWGPGFIELNGQRLQYRSAPIATAQPESKSFLPVIQHREETPSDEPVERRIKYKVIPGDNWQRMTDEARKR